MVMMAREMEIREEGRQEGREETRREDAERVAQVFGISLEKAQEILRTGSKMPGPVCRTVFHCSDAPPFPEAAVDGVKSGEEWRRGNILMKVREMEIRAEAYEEGFQEGLKEAREEILREDAERIARELGVSVERVMEALTDMN